MTDAFFSLCDFAPGFFNAHLIRLRPGRNLVMAEAENTFINNGLVWD
jgi:hypothetical protein